MWLGWVAFFAMSLAFCYLLWIISYPQRKVKKHLAKWKCLNPQGEQIKFDKRTLLMADIKRMKLKLVANDGICHWVTVKGHDGIFYLLKFCRTTDEVTVYNLNEYTYKVNVECEKNKEQ